jgi:hypothetical protein
LAEEWKPMGWIWPLLGNNPGQTPDNSFGLCLAHAKGLPGHITGWNETTIAPHGFSCHVKTIQIVIRKVFYQFGIGFHPPENGMLSVENENFGRIFLDHDIFS